MLRDKPRKPLTKSLSLQASQDTAPKQDTETRSSSSTLTPEALSDKISYAFQLATAQGPLCHEPVQGIAVFLEEVTVAPPLEEDASYRENLGRLTGEVIKTVRDSIRQGFLDWSPRLLLAMYSCEIQASGEYRSKAYLIAPEPFIDALPQPKSLVPRTPRCPAATDASSPRPSRKARPSSQSPPSSRSPPPLGSATRSESALPALPPLNSSSPAMNYWMKIHFGYRRR